LFSQIESTNGQSFAEIDSIVPVTKLDFSFHCLNKKKYVRIFKRFPESTIKLSVEERFKKKTTLTLRLLMSYTYVAPSKARNANVVYIWTYVWQR